MIVGVPALRFRIRTFIVISVLLGPIFFAVRDAWILGCAGFMLAVWGVLVASPLIVLAFLISWIRSEPVRDRVIAFCGALAVFGYVVAAGLSVIIIGLSASPFLR